MIKEVIWNVPLDVVVPESAMYDVEKDKVYADNSRVIVLTVKDKDLINKISSQSEHGIEYKDASFIHPKELRHAS